MLNNWDDVTSVCKNTSDQATKQVVRTDGGDKCSKTPLNVQVYMGYKSTEDPLYKIDKLMIRAAPLIKDDGDSVNYLEAVENYKENHQDSPLHPSSGKVQRRRKGSPDELLKSPP